MLRALPDLCRTKAQITADGRYAFSLGTDTLPYDLGYAFFTV